MGSAYRLLRRIWPFVGPVITVLALGRMFEVRVGQVISALIAIGPYISASKIGWFVLSVLSGFFAYVEIRHRHIPLTAIDTQVELALESPSGDLATLSRKQRLRANH